MNETALHFFLEEDCADAWSGEKKTPESSSGESSILDLARPPLRPRQVSEGLLLVALSRPHLRLSAVKAPPSWAPPPEAPEGLTGESSILKKASPSCALYDLVPMGSSDLNRIICNSRKRKALALESAAAGHLNSRYCSPR